MAASPGNPSRAEPPATLPWALQTSLSGRLPSAPEQGGCLCAAWSATNPAQGNESKAPARRTCVGRLPLRLLVQPPASGKAGFASFFHICQVCSTRKGAGTRSTQNRDLHAVGKARQAMHLCMVGVDAWGLGTARRAATTRRVAVPCSHGANVAEAGPANSWITTPALPWGATPHEQGAAACSPAPPKRPSLPAPQHCATQLGSHMSRVRLRWFWNMPVFCTSGDTSAGSGVATSCMRHRAGSGMPVHCMPGHSSLQVNGAGAGSRRQVPAVGVRSERVHRRWAELRCTVCRLQRQQPLRTRTCSRLPPPQHKHTNRTVSAPIVSQ